VISCGPTPLETPIQRQIMYEDHRDRGTYMGLRQLSWPISRHHLEIRFVRLK